MIHDAALAALHHLFAFGLVGMLMAQWALLRGAPTEAVLGRLARYDLWYGVCALGLVVVGVGRVLHGLKSTAFYIDNPVFWLKIGAFVAVGLISIMPTVQYRRWRAAAACCLPDSRLWTRVRQCVVVELHLLSVVMIAAALMARGIGAA